MIDIRKNTIGEIVAENFRTAAVFKKHGIDFCCRGGRTINEACEGKSSLNSEKIYEELSNIATNESNSIDFNSWELDLLSDYVEKIHHLYVKDKSPIILEFLDKLCKVHGENHPELYKVNELFHGTASDLASHLKKEEVILFPFIREMAKARRDKVELNKPHFGTVENPVHMMEHEHTIEGDRLAEIAKLTNNYTPPVDACNTYKVAYAMLQEFENDLHTHIHIENNILFPKSIQLEKNLSV